MRYLRVTAAFSALPCAVVLGTVFFNPGIIERHDHETWYDRQHPRGATTTESATRRSGARSDAQTKRLLQSSSNPSTCLWSAVGSSTLPEPTWVSDASREEHGSR